MAAARFLDAYEERKYSGTDNHLSNYTKIIIRLRLSEYCRIIIRE